MEPDFGHTDIMLALVGTGLMAGLIAGIVLLMRGWNHYRRYPLAHPAIDGSLTNRPWQAKDILMLVLFAVAARALANPLMAPSGENSEPSLTVLLLAGLGFQVASLFFIAFLTWRHGCGWRQAFGAPGRRRFPAFRLAVLVYLGMLPVLTLVTPVYHALLKKTGITLDWQDALIMLTRPQSPAMLAILLVMALVLAPVTEELIFRGILLPVLRRRMGAWPAIIFSSLLFAAFHQHIPSMAGLMIISVACSLAAMFSGTVVTAIWLHALFNAVSTLLAWTLISAGHGG